MNYDDWNITAGKLAIAVSPVQPTTACRQVFAYFEHNPDTPAIAVTDDDGVVVGLISRMKCLSMLARPLMLDLYSKRPVRLIMDSKPLMVDIATSLDDVTLLLATDYAQAALDGFVLCDKGFYVGIGKIVDLLAHTAEQNKHRAEVFELARREAVEASRYRGEFLANMSHEIRTPMNAIMGMTQLAMRLELPKQARSYLDKIYSASDSLLGIINDVLDFSKIDAGRMTLEVVDFELDTVIRDVATAVELRASDKGLEFLTSIDPLLPRYLSGDPLRLRQILLNLCSNAIKFTQEGEVVVQAQSIHGSDGKVGIKFSVRDSGIGLSPDQVSRLFQAFTQADASTTRRYGGTGLGLAICKQLTELMGGTIGVDSVPGQGSTFWVRLQLTEAAVPVAAPAYDDVDFPQLHVLIADDNSSARTIFADYLTAVGSKVEVVASGQEAVAAYQEAQSPFDLLLLDWKMPGLDGLDTIEHLRQLYPDRHLPKIIMISAYDQDAVHARSNQLGVGAFLTKPFSQRALLDAIQSVMSHHPAGDGQGLALDAPALPDYTDLRWPGVPVLLVDDNELNQELACELLQQAGFAVTIAENGQVALDLLPTQNFACVLMDIQMPVMDGYTASRAIRDEPRYADLPVIAMTADALERDYQRAIDAGMNDYISKPIDIEKMFKTLQKWIKIPG